MLMITEIIVFFVGFITIGKWLLNIYFEMFFRTGTILHKMQKKHLIKKGLLNDKK